MKRLGKIIFLIFITLYFQKDAFGQWNYLIKLFETNDKRTIKLIEKYNSETRRSIEVEVNEETYSKYKNQFKAKENEEIKIPGVYKSPEKFFHSVSTISTLIEDLNKQSVAFMSKGSKSGIEEIRATNAFSKTGLLSPELRNKPLSRERNSLINVKKVQVYISIPESPDEFIEIFKTPNNQQLKYSKQLKQKIANEKNANIHFLTSSDLLTKEIINSPDNMPIILIGHNEGGEFRLPDGSGKKFENMDSLANATKRSIIYLSCNSNNFTNNPAVPFYLTYNDGIAITNRINNALLKNISLSSDNQQTKKILNNIIQTYGKEKKQKFQYKIVAYSIAISGIGYTLYEIKQSDNK